MFSVFFSYSLLKIILWLTTTNIWVKIYVFWKTNPSSSKISLLHGNVLRHMPTGHCERTPQRYCVSSAIKTKSYLHSLLVDTEYSYFNLPIKYKFSGVVTGILTSLISSSSALSQELELAQAQLWQEVALWTLKKKPNKLTNFEVLLYRVLLKPRFCQSMLHPSYPPRNSLYYVISTIAFSASPAFCAACSGKLFQLSEAIRCLSSAS